LPSPLYLAVMVCVPMLSGPVVKVASSPFKGEEPRTVAPSRKVTVPVGCPLVVEVTVAVNVTD
jgi:hypothetical protein